MFVREFDFDLSVGLSHHDVSNHETFPIAEGLLRDELCGIPLSRFATCKVRLAVLPRLQGSASSRIRGEGTILDPGTAFAYFMALIVFTISASTFSGRSFRYSPSRLTTMEIDSCRA